MSDKTKKDKSDRIYLRVDRRLKGQVQKYCDQRGVTLSALVTTYLRHLLAEEQRAHSVDAEQF